MIRSIMAGTFAFLAAWYVVFFVIFSMGGM